MVEIEKLYELVGVKKEPKWVCDYDYGVACPDDNPVCEDCAYYTKTGEAYPTFTAEKQLELLKWIIQYDEFHASSDEDGYGICSENYSGHFNKDFAESLASFVTNGLWYNLSVAEKAEIKNILEV